MKNSLLITSLLVVALAIGCKPSTAKPAGETTEATAPQSKNAPIADKDTPMPTKDYNFGQKTECVMAMQAQLADLNRSLDELSAKIEKSSEAVKAEAAPKLAALREKTKQFTKQLDELSNATLPTWNVIKSDTEKAYTTLKDGVAESFQAVNDKIAP